MRIPYPEIPPEIVRIGPFALRWYGVMYLVGYAVGYRIARGRIRRGLAPFDERALDSLVVYLVVGMLVGARILYAVVYEPGYYLDRPLDILKVWRGGLSFHGAVLGMTAACGVFARMKRVPFWGVADTLALVGAPGLFFGRIGNFINAEVYGRPTCSGRWCSRPTRSDCHATRRSCTRRSGKGWCSSSRSAGSSGPRPETNGTGKGCLPAHSSCGTE